MIFYHGTCKQFAEQIKREGLIPSAHPFKTMRLDEIGENRGQLTEERAVYLTPSFNAAKIFATFRARYERAKPHTKIIFATSAPFTKLESTVIPDASPCIICISLPESFSLEDDTEAPNYRGQISRSPIPAHYIQSFLSLTKERINL